MRIIDVSTAEVRAVAVSPDGRFVAACEAGGWCAVFDWAGEQLTRLPLGVACPQFAFGPGNSLAYVHRDVLRVDHLESAGGSQTLAGTFAGGVAASPDGKVLVAAQNHHPNQSRLLRWSLPNFAPLSGFDFWSPFRRLAFSPDGQYLAGIGPGEADEDRPEFAVFELRYAATGGLDYRRRWVENWVYATPGFISFSPDSGLCAFGWEDEFRVLELPTSTSREARRVAAPFRDAAFTASGRHFATVGGDGALKLWGVKSWRVEREYDWGCGALTCLSLTADGSAGVCGTAGGQLVLFDVDE